jgi:DNA repair protein SbcD/Mre11
MKILHTADWHLGQRFLHFDRQIEQEAALNDLLQIIQNEQVDILIVAGDIFDTGNPPNYAFRQYYNFLRQCLKTNCRHLIITGGNHDSPATLDAPRELLKYLNIRVIGAARRDQNDQVRIEDEIVECRDSKGEVEAVIAAVPFLRDRDLKFSVVGETAEAIKNGIRQHYEMAAEAVSSYRNIPILTTGHLFAAGIGLETQEGEHDIHIGNLGKIGAEIFPSIFSYVALGHIHKAQTVGNQAFIRYSGSMIPLSFSERNEKKGVVLLDYEGAELKTIREIPIPLRRQLKRFQGDIETIRQQITTFENSEQELDTWAEVMIEADEPLPAIDQKVKEWAKDKRLEILKVRTTFSEAQNLESVEGKDLEDWKPIDVFEQKCKKDGLKEDEIDVLRRTFEELMESCLV